MSLVWCPHADCQTGYGASGRLPPICPACRRDVPGKAWLRSDPRPKAPFVITARDWFLLLHFGIARERSEP